MTVAPNRKLLILAATLTLVMFLPYAPESVTGVPLAGIIFIHVPSDYNNQTGSFTLSESICGGGRRNDGGTCMQFDYFQFSMTAGQRLQGHTSSSQGISFAILTWKQFQVAESYQQTSTFANVNQVQTFTTPSVLNWIAPQGGQYVLMFFTRMSYSGQVYLTQ